MISPVILAGGTGTRLWPLSRESYPKQFARILGDQSFFQSALLRVIGKPFAAPMIVTHEAFRFIVSEQMARVEVKASDILLEPARRDTAASVLAAAMVLVQRDPEALMLVCPADHIIADQEAFLEAIDAAVPVARAGQIVTFGIVPDRAETGYGYIEPESAGRVSPLRRFVEKPNADLAEILSRDGVHLWNSGMFMFQARTIIAAFRALAEDYVDPVAHALSDAVLDLGFTRIAPEPWGALRPLSLDYAVIEHADNLSVVRLDAGWLDLGGWDAVWRQELILQPDARGQVRDCASTTLECENVLVRNETSESHIVAIGLKNVMVINTADAVLVGDLSCAQQVGQIVKHLRRERLPQADRFRRDHRPWGWFETLARSERFQVKRIVVEPGAALSLQNHMHRAEHWIVVEGTARVTVEQDVRLISENESVYVPLGAKHRLENPGRLPMVLIEVQTGTYLGEDDIIRYEDRYAREGIQKAAE